MLKNAQNLYRAKRTPDGTWIEGGYFVHYARQLSPIGDEYKDGDIMHLICHSGFADWNMPRPMQAVDIDPATVGRCSGLPDKNGKLIFEGDITRLVLPGGEVRYFEVAMRTVIRNVVSHPTFDDATAKVAITGVVFLWRGFELFPCVDDSGVADNEKMEVVGNIHDNPELLEVQHGSEELHY